MTETASRIQQELFRALGLDSFKQDEQTRALFENAISRVTLSPQQEAVVSMLLSLNRMRPGSHDAVANDDVADDNDADDNDEVRQLREELRDLREVNDTVAAALGACPYCWGGDGACKECGGRGKPGSTAPDLPLFHRLVAPAVRRVSHHKEKNG